MSIDDTKDERPPGESDAAELTEDQHGLLDTFISSKREEESSIDGGSDDAPVTTEQTGRYRYEEKEIGREGHLEAAERHLVAA